MEKNKYPSKSNLSTSDKTEDFSDIFDLEKSLISISDASSMFREKISDSMPPFKKEVIKKNNDLVDEWYEKVLKKICGNNCKLPSLRVCSSLQIFEQGKLINKYMKIRSLLEKSLLTEQELKSYVSILENKSIEELYAEFGPFCIRVMFSLIVDTITDIFSLESYNKVYSRTEDVLQWEKLMNGEFCFLIKKDRTLPFGLTYEQMKCIGEKHYCFNMVTINPNTKMIENLNKISKEEAISIYHTDIKENISSFCKKLIQENNKFVKQWSNIMLNNLCDKDGKISLVDIKNSFTIFTQGTLALKYIQNLELFKRIILTKNEIHERIKIFKSNSISELYDNFGRGCVLRLQTSICNSMTDSSIKEEYENIYSKSSDPFIWYKIINDKYPSYLDNSHKLPFDISDEEYNLVMEKSLIFKTSDIRPDH